ALEVLSVEFQEVEIAWSEDAFPDPAHYETKVDSEDVNYYGRTKEITIVIPEDLRKEKEPLLLISYRGMLHDEVESNQFSREYVTDKINAYIGKEGVYLGPAAIFYPALSRQLFSFTLTTKIAEPYRTVTEGERTEWIAADGILSETWICNHPMDAIHLVAGQYQVEEIEHDGIRLATYFYAEQSELSPMYLEALKGYFDLYTDILGPYPYAKFAVVDNFFASGYGMPSYTLLGSQVLRLPFIVRTSLGHEVCHNWWGNSVYVDSETGNWCEGLTTYCADYLYKEQKSLDDAKEYRSTVMRDYTAYTNAGNDFPLVRFRERHNPAQRAVGYGKSAMLYHMLRRYVGEEDFWRSLKRFYNDNVWTYASWGDVQKAFEKETALKLSWFFDQWVNQTGAPSFTIENWQKSKIEGAWKISFTLNQTQNGLPYMLDVPVLVTGSSQTAHLQTTLSDTSQIVTLQTIFEPTGFSVDPDFEVFRRLDPSETPPTLADVFGKGQLTIVLPGLIAPEFQEAYASLANELRPHGGGTVTTIVNDYETTPAEIESGAVIFLGSPAENQAIPADWLDGNQWRVNDSGFLLADKSFTDFNNTLVAAGRHPDNLNIATAFIIVKHAPDALVIGRKLRHYGKYSYLVFQSESNVAKGLWKISDSPLSVQF
ncbi:MAG: M1 family aminopeptidase, partial [bacterium]